MGYQIKMRSGEEIEISESDYEKISRYLGQLKLFKLESGEIVNAVDISMIKPYTGQGRVSTEFRIEAPREREKKMKVPGGWQTLSKRELMKNMFNRMKRSGCFEGYQSYEEWEEAKYSAKS